MLKKLGRKKHCYSLTDQLEEAKNCLEPIINYDDPSEGLKLYCKILYKLEGEKLRLISILKKLRKDFEPDFVLLHMEFQLMIIQNDWKEAAVIAELGITKFEGHETFVHGLFVAMFKDKNLEGIKEHISLIDNRMFANERHAINITNALIAAEAYKESLEFLFRHASDKKNLECRQAFIMLSIKYPEGYWKQFERVEVGHFVKYTTGDVTRILEITEERKSAIPEQYLLGRSIGQTFSAPGGMLNRFTEIRIDRIMDKHVALMDEIMEDSRNPMSGMKVQTFTMDPDNPSAFIEMLKENFGLEGELKRESSEKELDAFHTGQISFTEVAATVFQRNYVDAYFVLTHSGNKPFRVISPAINQSAVTDQTIFVVDFTALLLFFELDKEGKIVFASPVVVADSTLHFVEELLEEARSNPFPKMSVSIFQEHIIPHFYADNSQEQRVNSLKTLLAWMHSHCTIEKAPEMVEYLASLKSEQQQQSGFMRCMLENRLLTDKPNHVLVTNDLFAVKHLKMGLQQILSPSKFLKRFYMEQFSSCLDFMLKRNYVGIPITYEMLKEEFINFLSGNPNKYTICLDNLSFYWNPDLNLVPEAMKFIKELYTTSLITPDKRSQTVLSVFQHLVSHMQKEHVEFTQNMLQDEFALLSLQLMEVQALLIQALRMR